VSNTSTQAPTLGGGEFRVGRILSRSLTVLLGNLPKYLVFGVIMAVPNFFSVLHYGQVKLENQSVSVANETNLTYILIGMVVFALCQATMIQGAFQDIRGQRFDLATSIQRGLARFLPVLATSVATSIIIFVGLFLLILPGLIFLTMFLVAVPACVVEGLGPVQSLGRSHALTKGYRWGIFAVCAGIAGITGAAIASFIAVAIISPYQALVAIVAYHDLRSVKEGLDIEQLAAVFD
jgi:hypothetical protein